MVKSLLNPGYLSTAYVLKHCSDIDLIVCEAQSSLWIAELRSPEQSNWFSQRAPTPWNHPTSRMKEGQKVLDKLGFPLLTSLCHSCTS